MTTAADNNWDQRRRRGAAALLFIAVVAAYWNTLDAPFVFDDRPAIVDNATIRHLGDAWRTPRNGSSAVGRPVVNVSFALNYAVGGLDPRGYHLVNLGLHALAALTLWGVLRRSLRLVALERPESMALAVALLWAIHPLLTESVTCVVQRSEVLAGLFFLLTLYAYLRSRETGGRRRVWEGAAVGACLLGVLTKEVVATAPLLLFLYDRTLVSGSVRIAWVTRSGFWLALLGTWVPLAGLVIAGGQRTGTVGFGLGVGTWDYLLTQCRALALYLKLAVWPHPLVIDYGVPVVRDWTEVAGRGLMVLALLGATTWALVKRPAWGLLGAAFFILLAPSSSFLPLTTQTIAEHRMYLPLIPVVLALGLGLRAVLRIGFPVGVTVLALVLAGTTLRRNEVYRDEFRLWRQTIADLPENPRGYSNLGNAHVRRGEWAQAIEQLAEAVRIQPDFADAQNNLGLALLEVGQLEPALTHLAAAARLKPDDADILYNLGNGCARAGRTGEALAAWERAVALREDFAAAHYRIGEVRLRQGDAEPAAAHFARAAKVEPAYVEALAGWGDALWQLAKGEEAVAKYQAALRVAPKHAGLHYNLANILLGLGRLPEAVEEYRQALSENPAFAAAEHNLGLALLRMDRPAEAVPHFRAALQQMPASSAIHANLSRALAGAGELSEAVRAAEEALRLDPGDTALRAWQEKLHLQQFQPKRSP